MELKLKEVDDWPATLLDEMDNKVDDAVVELGLLAEELVGV